MAQENPGQTLQATALVHEAYVRLVDGEISSHWDSRGHFFAAAAEAMRRILIDNARRKQTIKQGGDRERKDFQDFDIAVPVVSDDILALDEALCQLQVADSKAAELVKLRYFAGLTVEQSADALGISPRTADFLWSYARAWLRQKIEGDGSGVTRQSENAKKES